MHCDLDLWPFDLKIYRAHPCLMGRLHVKFHDDRWKGKAVMRRKPKCGRTDGRTDRRTDRRTDGRTWWFQYTPPNFVAGGITRLQWYFPTSGRVIHPKCLSVFLIYHVPILVILSEKICHSQTTGMILNFKPSIDQMVQPTKCVPPVGTKSIRLFLL